MLYQSISCVTFENRRIFKIFTLEKPHGKAWQVLEKKYVDFNNLSQFLR